MVNRRNRWQLASWSDEFEQLAKRLSKQLSIPTLVTKLLIQRGYRDEASIEAFLYGTTASLHDPFQLADMEKAVKRIMLALERNEKVRIYGDYDADGVSSTTLLCYTFDRLGLQYDYYIPHRMLEGYGMNRAAIDKAKQEGVELIVTVDTGISAYDEVNYAASLGIDVVVTDHHEPPEQLPQAYAVVNPKQEHCPYPFKGLAGVGVAFKLATALLDKPPMEWSGVVALGTIADLMPLEDENRILVSYGLAELRKGEHIGFNALAEASGAQIEELTATKVGFGLAPRINAAGRLDHASIAVQLLTSMDKKKAEQIAAQLDALNKERQEIVEEMVVEAEEQWQRKKQLALEHNEQEPSVIVVAQTGWNVGVIGIVASKLLERYYKPVLVFGIDGETKTAKGSARSIEGFDLHAALSECEELLLHYGGHQAAAGMTVAVEALEQLEQKLSGLANQWLSEEDWIPKLTIDLSCKLSDVTLDTISQLSLLEPFGMSNPSPRVLIKGAAISERKAIGKEGKHLKLQLKDHGSSLDVIGFGKGEYERLLHPYDRVEVVGELNINEWNSIRKPQLQLYDLHVEKDRLKVFPSREQFGIIYQYIRKQGSMHQSELVKQLCKISGLGQAEIELIIDVFEELNFIVRKASHITAVSKPQKRELTSSTRYHLAWQDFEAN
ncbi:MULTISPECIES: single-stranded-DNA-specific exonuclease RecJ [Paenibacillus]|uniref:single-stranded-DNA-specific exonuclease RecJ n=1 Tax=Paenibacillus TaxID=44249 RepID=UPI00203D230A|nr:single-stranded-DNA-specific exonuclease RecJ [Paenibacillus camelliae]MCM3632413.1 single-stranded-DNA-specific exonuclease RecJ [Paenibacillus camelliae]